jgi:hypothetical protein
MPRQRWNPPPGWPAPPPGWKPWPGWQADPEWPTPPADWLWWIPQPKARLRRILLGITFGVVGLLVGTLVVADIVDHARRCGSIDPGDPANYSSIQILNDTKSPVTIDECQGSYCSGANAPVELPPGQALQERAACGVSGTQMTSWRVIQPSGQVLGYMAIESQKKHDGLVYTVSRASRDRRTPTPSR